jgi:hypothetical protein
MHLLIPYVRLLNHPDPAFDEFTYGDCGQRARKLKSDLSKGDYVFFHTRKHGKKHITAYYIVDRVLDTVDVCQDRPILAKYKNPHSVECLTQERPIHGDDDAILFGEITSQALERPLLFDRQLAEKLSLNIKFPANKSETQVIGSATRAWRELTDKDVRVLLKAIDAEKKHVRSYSLWSTEEVAETLEKDIEYFIAHNPALFSKGLKFVRQQKFIGDGRLDLLFEDRDGNWVVVEVKFNQSGRNTLRQIKTYIQDLREETNKNISGVIVCAGVMPAYEDELRRERDIRIFIYGWDLLVQQW